MSVKVIDRKESRYEAFYSAVNLRDTINEFAHRNFGLKDLDHFVRMRYAYRKDETENFAKYRYLLENSKKNLDMTCRLLVNTLTLANDIHRPSTSAEFDKKNEYLTIAIGYCDSIRKGLQEVITDFEVDINKFIPYEKEISREIELIKRWRQKTNQLKKSLRLTSN